MVRVLGLDIGGANTKAACISTSGEEVSELVVALEYFPFWKRDRGQLVEILSRLGQRLCGSEALDAVAVTLTAELSDAFRTKREGVAYVLSCIGEVFGGDQGKIMVLDVDASLRSVSSALAEPLKVASANWAATGWMVAQREGDCVVVDVGSTSTSIIPVTSGVVSALGKTDLDKLANGELVYTGILRTNVAATVQVVPLRGRNVRVSSELFATSGDVHLVLGNITEVDFTADTADGKGKTRDDALARLARVVCADVDMLSEREIVQIAKYAYERQIVQVAFALAQVYDRLGENAKKQVPVVLTGLGKDFLARKAAERACISNIISLDSIMPKGAALASPAAGVALMAASELTGKELAWKL